MARKTKTPRWLSIVRKLYIYIGVGTIYAVLEYLKLNPTEMKLAIELYGFGAIAIQVICDAYFLKDDSPLPKFPTTTDKIKP